MFSRQFLVIFPGLFTRTIEYATFNPTVSPTPHPKKKGRPKGLDVEIGTLQIHYPKNQQKEHIDVSMDIIPLYTTGKCPRKKMEWTNLKAL